MKKKNTHKTIIIGVSILTIFLILILLAMSRLMPPTKNSMERLLERDNDEISIITDYLKKSSYSYIYIDRTKANGGLMFTGAYSRDVSIEDDVVQNALKRLLTFKGYKTVVKDGTTIYFEKWSFLEKSRGLATSENSKDGLNIEFLISAESLNNEEWYYYEADYEEYRAHN